MTTRTHMNVVYGVIASALLVASTSTSAAPFYYTQQQNQASKFESLSAAERKQAEEAYKVDNIFNINTDNKPALTTYYVANPPQYGPYATAAQAEYDPFSLIRGNNNSNDNRRYPVYGQYLHNCNNPSHNTNRPLYTRPVDSDPVYNYVNKRITQSREPGVTLYSNFSANPNTITRW